jgi:hypothetical protein
MSMKVLFLSLYADTPHFETELELISDLLEQGHEVHVLRCRGELAACIKNPDHRPGWCKVCVSKIDDGLRSLAVRVEELGPAPAVDLPDFDDAEQLKQYCFQDANIGRGVYSTVCSRINKDTKFDTRKYAADIRRELQSAHHVFTATRALLSRLRPDAVYLFNGRFATSYAAVEACRQSGVDFFTHERGGTPDRYLLRKNALPHDIQINHQEILASWGEGGDDKVAAAERWYRARRDGQEKSWESFTKAQTVGRLPDGFDPGKRNIAIFNSTMEEYASIKGWEPTLYPDEVQGLVQIVRALGSRPDVKVWLRVHPNLKNIARGDNYQLREYGLLEAGNLTIIWPESPVHTYALLDACQVTLTFGSTVGAEACFWKKPSVLAGRALYEQLGCCHRPQSHEELMALLLGDPPCQPPLGALQYGYWETVRGTPYRKFEPTGLYSGRFKGRECRPSLAARLQSALLTTLGR